MTTTTAKHTRTPWKVLPDTHKIGGHPNHLFRFIATANWTEDDGDFSTTGEIIAKLTDSQNIAANASFIVRACNAHDDLLAACEALSRRMDAWARCGNPPQHEDKAAMSMARAAIRKAGGEA